MPIMIIEFHKQEIRIPRRFTVISSWCMTGCLVSGAAMTVAIRHKYIVTQRTINILILCNSSIIFIHMTYLWLNISDVMFSAERLNILKKKKNKLMVSHNISSVRSTVITNPLFYPFVLISRKTEALFWKAGEV
jgi:hypothetical protein